MSLPPPAPDEPAALVSGPPPPTPPAPALAVSAAVSAGLLALVWVALNLMAGPVVRRVEDGLVRGDPTAVDSILIRVYDYLALPALGITIVAWVLTCVWLTRARDYGEAINPTIGHERGSVWVWLGWLVPVVLLWFPFQVVRDVHRSVRRPLRVPAVLRWWWAAWLAVLLSNRVHDSLVSEMFESGDLDVAQAQVSGIVAAVATVVALALWLAVVRRIAVGKGPGALRT